MHESKTAHTAENASVETRIGFKELKQKPKHAFNIGLSTTNVPLTCFCDSAVTSHVISVNFESGITYFYTVIRNNNFD